ncbi:MAG TPA: transporter, partial [Armatimonadetes bacterium]|nr:transporter [Armatimonadota bacterium]
MFHPIDVAVVFIYLFFIGLLGLWQAVRIRTAGDFFAGGRKFNKFLMMMHALGTGTHADDPVGVVGASFQRGYSGIWYTYVYLLATPFYWLIAPLFRRSRYLTTADFFEQRYSPGLGLLYAVMGVLIFAINTGTLLVGTEMITTAVTQGAVPGWAAILAMTVVFVVYGSAGGL